MGSSVVLVNRKLIQLGLMFIFGSVFGVCISVFLARDTDSLEQVLSQIRSRNEDLIVEVSKLEDDLAAKHSKFQKYLKRASLESNLLSICRASIPQLAARSTAVFGIQVNNEAAHCARQVEEKRFDEFANAVTRLNQIWLDIGDQLDPLPDWSELNEYNK